MKGVVRKCNPNRSDFEYTVFVFATVRARISLTFVWWRTFNNFPSFHFLADSNKIEYYYENLSNKKTSIWLDFYSKHRFSSFLHNSKKKIRQTFKAIVEPQLLLFKVRWDLLYYNFLLTWICHLEIWPKNDAKKIPHDNLTVTSELARQPRSHNYDAILR